MQTLYWDEVAQEARYRDLTAEEVAEVEARSVVDLAVLKKALAESVDAHIADIYKRWLRFEAEYVEREAAARDFAAGGYVGDPGEWVAAYATNAGKTNTEAADIIIAQADALRAALKDLGALRMAKYGILTAPDAETAQAAQEAIVAQANEIAAGL